MTEHDLIDAERLAERPLPDATQETNPLDRIVASKWALEAAQELAEEMQSAIKQLVREVRKLRGERDVRRARETVA